MRAKIAQRLDMAKAVYLRPWVVAALAAILSCWALSGSYDLLVAQWLPSSWAKKMPRVFDVVEALVGLVSPSIWGMIFFGAVAAFAIEYTVRNRPAASVSASYGGTGPADVELGRLTNAHLRDRAIAFARNLRTLETSRRAEQMSSMTLRDIPFEERSRIFTQQHERERLLFRNDIRPEMMAMLRELSRRAGVAFPNDETRQMTAVEHGMLAGPEPLSEVADYIDTIARRLGI